MSQLIAITGKGGTGKTTLAALLIRALAAKGKGPVLAVDADPNSCLDIALGVKVEHTIGSAREETREIAGKGMSTGVSKQQLLEMSIAQSMVEADGFDLISMGRPEGPGCYCYANNVLRQALTTLSAKYPSVVLDNEAGLENLSRRIVQKVDQLIIVADPSKQGISTIPRLHALALEMGMSFNKLVIVINKVRLERSSLDVGEIKVLIPGAEIRIIPDDQEVAAAAEEGRSLFTISENNPVYQAVLALIH